MPTTPDAAESAIPAHVPYPVEEPPDEAEKIEPIVWNRYVNENKPWATGEPKVIFNAVVILDSVAALLKPFLPETAEKIKEQITIGDSEITIRKAGNLFPRV